MIIYYEFLPESKHVSCNNDLLELKNKYNVYYINLLLFQNDVCRSIQSNAIKMIFIEFYREIY